MRFEQYRELRGILESSISSCIEVDSKSLRGQGGPPMNKVTGAMLSARGHGVQATQDGWTQGTVEVCQMRAPCRGDSSNVVRWFLIAILVMASGSANAEWMALPSQYQAPGLQIFYVDSATMRRDGQFVNLWQLTDYVWTQGDKGGFRFRSTTTQKQFDCETPRVRLLASVQYSDPMATGVKKAGVIDSRQQYGAVGPNWSSIDIETTDSKTTSLNQGLWDLTCGQFGKDTPSGRDGGVPTHTYRRKD